MNPRRIATQTALLLSIVVTTLGCGTTEHETPPDIPAIVATIAQVQSADLPETFEAGGIVRSRTTALVASRILAPVAAVHVRAGDRVRRGDRLVTLDGREMTANQARAAAAVAGSAETVSAAEGAVRSAEAALALALATHARIQTLHEKRSATTQERDQAVASLDAAEGQLASARANLAAAIAGRRAAVAANDAASAVASYTVLTAPFDGVVTERRADPGDMAAPGAPLLVLEDPSGLHLEATLDEARARAIVSGQPAQVSFTDGRTDPSWIDTTISEIARIDPDAHSFRVKLELPPAATTPSGSFGRARFTGASRRALVVPASAVLRRGQLAFAFVVDANGRVHLQPISPGAAVGDTVEVLAGLTEGARVVVGPPPSLSEGMRISEGQP